MIAYISNYQCGFQSGMLDKVSMLLQLSAITSTFLRDNLYRFITHGVPYVRSQEKYTTALETKSVARVESLALAPLVGTFSWDKHFFGANL